MDNFVYQLTLTVIGENPSTPKFRSIMDIIEKISVKGKAVVFPIPGNIVVNFYTHKTVAQTSELLMHSGTFWMIGENCAFAFPEPITTLIQDQLKKAGMNHNTEIKLTDTELSLDDLLDLVNKNGLDALSPYQKTRLKLLSK